MRVLMPETLTAACELLAADPGIVPLAGGTDLLVHWPQRLADHDRTYLDLSGLAAELRPIAWSDEDLILGALTTFWDVICDDRLRRELPLLRRAASEVGSLQIQTRGTWAGNIANASPAADGVLALMAYDARVLLQAAGGSEEIPLAEYYLGYKQTRRRPDQLIRAILVPRREYAFELFEKVGSRRLQTITKVGVAVVRSAAGWRVVANSVAPTVCRCPALERLLGEEAPVGSAADLLPAIRRDVAPIDDLRSTAAYRERVMARLLYHGLRDACRSFG